MILPTKRTRRVVLTACEFHGTHHCRPKYIKGKGKSLTISDTNVKEVWSIVMQALKRHARNTGGGE